MKKLLFSFLVLLIASSTHAQDDIIDETNSSSDYEILDDIVVKECNSPLADTANPAVKVTISQGENGYVFYKFHVHRTLSNGDVVITFNDFGESTDGAAIMHEKYNYRIKSEAPARTVAPKSKKIKQAQRKEVEEEKPATDDDEELKRYFILTAADLRDHCRKVYSIGFLKGMTVTGGVAILPLKYRPRIKYSEGVRAGNDLSKDVSLGLSIGVKQRISRRKPFFMNVLFSPGLGSVGLDSFNTKGKVSSSKDISALTLAGGLVFDFKMIQFGAFIGADLVSDKNESGWIYQGRPWLSIGVGFTIFSVSTQSSSNNAAAKQQTAAGQSASR